MTSNVDWLQSNHLYNQANAIVSYLSSEILSRTRIGITGSIIKMTSDAFIPGNVIVHFHDKNERETEKPKHIHGAEMKRMTFNVFPLDWDQLINSIFSTKSPIRLAFTGDGKTVYFAMHWENTVRQKNPWNVIINATIP